MRKLTVLAAILLPLLLAAQDVAAKGSKAIDYEQTERRRDGLIYKVGSETPLSGLVREVYSRKKKKSEVHYVDGKLDGLTTRWWPNGQMQFSGNFEGGRPTGLRTDYYPNGHKKTERTLVNGVPDGISTTWDENGNKRREATMVGGVAHGLMTIWDKHGNKKSEDHYVDGQEKLEGPSTKWNDKGQIVFQGSYASGKFTGEVIRRSGSGQAFVEEKLVDGKRIEYAETLGQEFANGQFRGEQRWINGKRHETFWYENGQKERFSTVGDATEDGQLMKWYENGQKKVEFRQVFGVTEGLVTYWYENGQKKSESTAVHGKKNGVETEWYEDGRKKSETNYIAGKPVDPNATPADPPPPSRSVVLKPDADVTYRMHRGSIRFWDTAIQSVSDGQFSGNTAIVSPGAAVRMTGNWAFGPVTDPGNCPGCVVQIYVAWVPDATDRGAWPPNEGLWSGMANSVKSNSEPSGTFDWTTEAPTLPGVYYVGRGQTLDFGFKRLTQGKPGAPTEGPDTVKAASFRIEVRSETAD